MSKWGLPLILGAIVLVMGGLFLLGNKQPASKPEAQLIGTKHEDQGQEHIAEGASHKPYNSNLPSSGPHYVQPAEWGVYDKEIAEETFVHNLEHGGIVIAYKPDLSKDKVDRLKALVEQLPKKSLSNKPKIVMMPRAKNDKAIKLAAWTYTFDLDDFDEAKITQFYNEHVNQGPEKVDMTGPS